MKDPPKWAMEMVEGDEEEDAEEEEDDEEDAEEKEEKKPILKRKERDQHGDGGDQDKKKKKVKFAEILEKELGEALTANYEVKFSTEIFLPMRRRRDQERPMWEAGCPIDLNDRTNSDDQKVKATWPDGFETELGETYEDLRTLMPSGSRSMEVAGSKLILEQTHKTTKNLIKVDQRVDRNLLIAIYENGRQILQNRVDEFGPCANENQRLPETDETILKAYAFMKPIFDMYVKDEISKDELVPLRNKLMAERKAQNGGKAGGKTASRGPKEQSKKPEGTSKGAKGTSESSGSKEASKGAGPPSKQSSKKQSKEPKKAAEEKKMVLEDDADETERPSEARGAPEAKPGNKSIKIQDLQIKLPPIRSTLEIFEILLEDPDADKEH